MSKPRPSSDRSRPRRARTFEYDVCLSFAGENRRYVDEVHQELVARGVRVFYDEAEQVSLWGKDLYSHLDYVYRKAARYCVLFVSRQYASKVWTNHERRSAQARALQENREYILPVRFDSTSLPGLLGTTGFIRLKGLKPRRLADLIVKKLGPRQQADFFPPVPDLLYKRMGARTVRARREILVQLRSLFDAVGRMDRDERTVIFQLITHSCPNHSGHFRNNLHMNLDLLRRVTGLPVPQLRKILGGLASLGFYCQTRAVSGLGSRLTPQENVELQFYVLSTSAGDPGPHNSLLESTLDVMRDYLCEGCALRAFVARDFSQLSSSTAEEETHSR